MRLSNFADYAVVVMSTAARLGVGKRISTARLAAETGLPAPTVQKLAAKLVAGGLLQSIRGANGGLQLARPASTITLVEIVEAVEGPIALTSCILGRPDCALGDKCAISPHWNAVNAALRGALAEVPLTRFAEMEATA